MKCPNCNTALDNEALVCFACGQEIPEKLRRQSRGDQDREFDEAIQSLLPDEEAEAEKELQQKLERKKKGSPKKRRAAPAIPLCFFGGAGSLASLFYEPIFKMVFDQWHDGVSRLFLYGQNRPVFNGKRAGVF